MPTSVYKKQVYSLGQVTVQIFQRSVLKTFTSPRVTCSRIFIFVPVVQITRRGASNRFIPYTPRLNFDLYDMGVYTKLSPHICLEYDWTVMRHLAMSLGDNVICHLQMSIIKPMAHSGIKSWVKPGGYLYFSLRPTKCCFYFYHW